jgi:hypothetical protein
MVIVMCQEELLLFRATDMPPLASARHVPAKLKNIEFNPEKIAVIIRST